MTTSTAAPGPVPQVVGLDLSLTSTGIAYRDGSVGTIVGPSDLGDRRLTVLKQAVHVAVGDEDAGLGRRADLVAIEDLPTNAKSSGATGMVHGVVRALLLDLEIPYVVLPPATLKAYSTGRGNVDKTAMAISAYKRVQREFANDDECDAFWLRAAALDRLGRPEFDLPAAWRQRLDVVAWPGEPAPPKPRAKARSRRAA